MKVSKKQEIVEFFKLHPYQTFESDSLHRLFGPAFRSRVSEINRDNSIDIAILQTKGEISKSAYFGVSFE